MKLFEKYPILMIIIGVLGVSLSAIFVRISQAPSVVTAAWRLLITVALMSPVVLGRSGTRTQLLHIEKGPLLLSALSGVLLAIHFLTWFEGLHYTTVASATIIVSTEVIWVALGYCLFLKGKLSRKALLAIAITFAGSILIALSDSGGGGNLLYGDLLSLAAAVAVGGYTLIGRVVRSRITTTIYTYIVYVCAAAALLAIMKLQGFGLLGWGYTGILSGLLLAVFSTLLGHSIFSWCLKYFSPTFVSASKLCEPVVSSLFAAFLFFEVPGVLQLVGSAIILAGVVYYSRIELTSQS